MITTTQKRFLELSKKPDTNGTQWYFRFCFNNYDDKRICFPEIKELCAVLGWDWDIENEESIIIDIPQGFYRHKPQCEFEQYDSSRWTIKKY